MQRAWRADRETATPLGSRLSRALLHDATRFDGAVWPGTPFLEA